MLDKYQDWIDAKVGGDPAKAREMCYSWTLEMVQEFPELTTAKGWIKTHCGDVQHWWCKTESGEIIDPSAIQFLDERNPRYQYGKPHAIYGYEEYRGPECVGKCIQCGTYCLEGYTPAPHACSEECGLALEPEYIIFKRDETGAIVKTWKDFDDPALDGVRFPMGV